MDELDELAVKPRSRSVICVWVMPHYVNNATDQ